MGTCFDLADIPVATTRRVASLRMMKYHVLRQLSFVASRRVPPNGGERALRERADGLLTRTIFFNLKKLRKWVCSQSGQAVGT